MENEIKLIEALNLHWDNYKMRQAHYWQSLNRFTLAIITLWAVPYVKPDLFNSLGKLILFFPIVALGTSICCWWLLKEEYHRLYAVIIKFNQLMPEAFRPDFSKKDKKKFLSIGRTLTVISSIGFIGISIANMIFIGLKVLSLI